MFLSMRSQKASLVPLFKLGEMVTRVKMQMDDILESSGAVILSDDNPYARFAGWGEEAVSAIFKSLQSLPQIDIPIKSNEL